MCIRDRYHIDVTDIRQLEVTEKEKALDEKRAEMSHQVIQTDEWPLFDVRITKIEDQKHRIHISFDNIIFDGWSTVSYTHLDVYKRQGMKRRCFCCQAGRQGFRN